jgi:hypothetical protein
MLPESDIVRSVGALEQWQSELRAGVRTKYDVDPLWHAACREAMANDFARMGLPRVADDLRREAAKIIVEAARKVSA